MEFEKCVYIDGFLKLGHIYKAKILSVCLSICLPVYHAVTHLGPSTSPYQLPNIKNPSSFSFKFVTASKYDDQLAFYSRLKTKKWRKLEQHSIENHSHITQLAVQLTCIQEIVGLNPGGEQIFFEYLLLQTRFQHCFFTFQAHIEAKLNARNLGTRIC